jgi:DNA-binding NtrC family response regulator
MHVASQASAIGIHGFIEKPFSVDVLVQSLARLIQSKRSQRPPAEQVA